MSIRPEAYIVLGGGITADGKLSESSVSRAERALQLYRELPLPIVVSGKWSLLAENIPPYTEAAALHDYMLGHDIPREHIHREAASMDTMGNAYFTYMQYIRPQQWRGVRVITSAFHRERAACSFGKVLGASCVATIETSPETTTPDHQLVMREHKIMTFMRSLFDQIPDGDSDAIGNALSTLCGYSDTPMYSRQRLLDVIGGSDKTGQHYNIR